MSKKNPLVTIIIPVYNGSNYLGEAIDSALAQTYKNIEVIVVNDGSTDDGKTEKIALTYGNKIRYYLKKNGGVATAMNFGIDKMRGDWFAWLSHDDLMSKRRIETDLIFLSDKYLVSFTDILFIDDQRKKLGEIKYINQYIKSAKVCWENGCLHMCSMTISKNCLKKHDTFNEKNALTQDVEFVLKLSKKCIFVHNTKAISFVRIHSASDTQTRFAERPENNRQLITIIDNEIGIEGFFPQYQTMGFADKSHALNWMGELYRVLGDNERALEYYNLANIANKTLKSVVKKLLGPRVIGTINKLSKKFSFEKNAY